MEIAKQLSMSSINKAETTGFDEIIYPKEFKSRNYKKDEPQEVFPFKEKDDIERMKGYFLSKGQDRNYLLFVFGINFGLRCGDLLSLKWNMVLDNEYEVKESVVLREEKTEKFRTLFINNSVRSGVVNYIKKNGYPVLGEYIFQSQKTDNSGKLEVRSVCKILKDAAKAVGIKFNVGTHSMRKTWGYWQYITHIESDPQFIFKLQEMLNHSSMDITLAYIGISRERNKIFYNDINL